MNAELIFYATDEDMKEFLDAFKNADFDKTEKSSSGIQQHFYTGNEHVQLLFPKQRGELLLEGRIARKTLEKGEDSDRADKLFKEMRKWIKKHFICSKMLAYREDKGETKKDARVSPLQAKCISPRALKMYEEGAVTLKEHAGTPWVELPGEPI